jgi:hypothetical protein
LQLAIKAASGAYDLKLRSGRTLPKKPPLKTKIRYHQERSNNNHLECRQVAPNLKLSSEHSGGRNSNTNIDEGQVRTQRRGCFTCGQPGHLFRECPINLGNCLVPQGAQIQMKLKTWNFRIVELLSDLTWESRDKIFLKGEGL